MIVVGENLRQLMEQHSVAPRSAFDEFSITLLVDRAIYRPRKSDRVVNYPFDPCDDLFELQRLEDNASFRLDPGDAVLACSSEEIRIPLGYFGLLQTKGSLARLFCSVHLCDAQIEPGFRGKITFEIANLAPFSVTIRVGSPVAQLFMLRCSDSNTEVYSGGYANSDLPTLYRPRIGLR